MLKIISQKSKRYVDNFNLISFSFPNISEPFPKQTIISTKEYLQTAVEFQSTTKSHFDDICLLVQLSLIDSSGYELRACCKPCNAAINYRVNYKNCLLLIFKKRIREALELEDLEEMEETSTSALNILNMDKFSHKGASDENGHAVTIILNSFILLLLLFFLIISPRY